ncbi:MAG: hypothetical protein ABR564_02125 [Candidatus Dormibacteria bacterium]
MAPLLPSPLRRVFAGLAAAGWAAALVAGPALGAAGVVYGEERAQQNCFVLCPSTPPPVTPTAPALAPAPQPFTVPPVSNPPNLAPAVIQPVVPSAPSATATPSPVAAAPPPPTAVPTPSATPVTVGADHNGTIPLIEPTSTGGGLDGGGLFLRIFLVLGFLAAGSVASLFALR